MGIKEESMEFFRDLFVLVGRVLISGMFLWGAYEKIRNWSGAMAYMKARKVPQLKIVLPVSIGLGIVGGLSVFFGWHAHFGALLLLIVAIPSALTLHRFWKFPADEQDMEKVVFMREIAVIGGLFLLLALGAGHFIVR